MFAVESVEREPRRFRCDARRSESGFSFLQLIHADQILIAFTHFNGFWENQPRDHSEETFDSKRKEFS
ncbi:MAG: hypothetical protein DMG62_20285 [Acidobacteria bacterium]|nr:MAG: hypothetical protein DMG62_20285 [Acidobacteriota bacterium]